MKISFYSYNSPYPIKKMANICLLMFHDQLKRVAMKHMTRVFNQNECCFKKFSTCKGQLK